MLQVDEAPGSLVEAAYEQIRRDIIFNELPSGSKLRIDELRSRYGFGATPLREALSRLTAVGLVETASQRGFRVAPVSVKDLEDVTESRVRLETQLLAESIAAGDDAWEGRVAGTFHTLSKLEAAGLSLDPASFSRWEERNSRFHDALISCSTSRWTARFRATIYDHHERYRRISHVVGNRSFDVRHEHAAICEAALARDADAACRLTAAHIRTTGEAIRIHLGPQLV